MPEFHGHYVLDEDGVRYGGSQGILVCSSNGQLAIAFDSEDGILHKHGEATAVRNWANATSKQLANSGWFEDLALAMTVIAFPATEHTIDEMNACIADPGRLRYLEYNLAALASAENSLGFMTM